MTIRFDPEMAEALATVAAVDGKPVSEIIRIAVTDHVKARQADSRFRVGLRQHIAKAQRLLSDHAA